MFLIKEEIDYYSRIYKTLSDKPIDIMSINKITNISTSYIKIALGFLETHAYAKSFIGDDKKKYYIRDAAFDPIKREAYVPSPLPLRYTPREKPYVSMMSKVKEDKDK